MHKVKALSGIFFVLLISVVLLFSSQSMAYKRTEQVKKLYKQWTDVIGYSAKELVDKMDPAPEIKPGMVITPQNYKDYPGLKKLLPETIYKRLNPNFFCPIKRMEICETRPRYYPQEIIDASRKNIDTVKLNKDTWQIEGWECGVPFPRVSSPLHVIWNHNIANLSFEQNLMFDPVTATTYNRNREVDSVWKALLGRYRVMGRHKINGKNIAGDIGKNHVSKYFQGKGIFEQGTLLMTYPADAKGQAFLRTRYWDVQKADRFVSYLPGLRRIRVLSGSDAQDPILGSELIWDSWAVEWQKQPTKNPDLFPNEYKLLGKRIILQPTYPQHASLRIEGEQFYTKWEKRPVWVLEIKSKDPSYVFSKRIMYAGMEQMKALYEEYYDRRGNLMRTWEDFKYLTPGGQCTWEGCDILNHATKRHTLLKMNSTPNPPLEPSQFSMKWLNRMAR